MNNLQFKLVINKITVTLEAPDGASSADYELREMTAASRDSYLDRLSDRMRIDAAGKPAGLKRYAGLQADLVSQCLFNDKGEPVPAVEIQKWPSAVVGSLFKSAQELNKLGQDEEETASESEPKNA